jgi:hypothetical protein
MMDANQAAAFDAKLLDLVALEVAGHALSAIGIDGAHHKRHHLRLALAALAIPDVQTGEAAP